MTKRSREDLDGLHRKKSKVHHETTEPKANGVATNLKVLKDERRERKRLKKEEQRLSYGASAGKDAELKSKDHTQPNGVTAPEVVENPTRVEKKQKNKKKGQKVKKLEEAAVGGLKREDVAIMVRRAMQKEAPSLDEVVEASAGDEVGKVSDGDKAAAEAEMKVEKVKRKKKGENMARLSENGEANGTVQATDLDMLGKAEVMEVGVDDQGGEKGKGGTHAPEATKEETGQVQTDKDARKAEKAARKAEKAKRTSQGEQNPQASENGMVNGTTQITDPPVPDIPRRPDADDDDQAREEGKGETPADDVITEQAGRGRSDKAARKAEKAERKKLKAAKRVGQLEIATTPSEADGRGVNGTSNGPEPATFSSTVMVPGGLQYHEHPTLASLPQSTVTTYLEENFITITDPTSDTPLRPIISFSHLSSSFTVSPSPFAAFKAPTPIQSASWPFLLSGRDVIGVAETGSGKTLAFGVPCIRSLQSSAKTNTTSKQKNKDTASPARAVIISPTRELAIQIHEQLTSLATPAGLSTACVYGGVPKDTQRLALSTAHIIVATPGRLNDLIDESSADLSSVHYLVLDEADRMLDKGFEDQIRNIITHTPSTPTRQTLMFTATWPPSVRDLASTFMTSPVHIAIGANNPTGELRANTRIVQKVEVVAPEDKQARMLQIIKTHQPQGSSDRILAFCLYKKEAVRVESFLHSRGLRVAAIHGDMSQQARLASLESFKSGSCPLLVATDVAARGLDIPEVKLVLNITFPLTAEDYVHRIGRTGRAGKEGLAITLFTVHDKAQSGALVNVLRAAGQVVPKELLDFGGTVKRKEHGLYGAFARDVREGGKSKGKKIRFD